jgi:hypothetical protein
MKTQFTNRHRLAVLAAVLTLTTALLGETGGFAELARISYAALAFPGQIITGFRNSSLDWLDPTFPRTF